jgi:hypothetical protein
MATKCSVTLTYEGFGKQLHLGVTHDHYVTMVVRDQLILEAEQALHGAEAIGDAVLITTFQNDLDTLQKVLDMILPGEHRA